MGLHTAIETSGYLGDRVDDNYLSSLNLILLDIKSSDPDTYRNLAGRALAPSLRFAERLATMGKRGCVRFTLVRARPVSCGGLQRPLTRLPSTV